MNTQLNCFNLNNNVRIPAIGFGTWLVENGDEAVRTVSAALERGYRHIDTAAAYGNARFVFFSDMFFNYVQRFRHEIII